MSDNLLEEILAGDSLSLSAAARLFGSGRSDRPLTPSAVWRWANKGAKSPSGVILKLEVARCGNSYRTSRAAIKRFLSALNPTPSQPVPPAPAPAKKQKRSAKARAVEQLDKAGI